MGRLGRNVVLIGFTALSLALSMSPGFGQAVGGSAEPRSERLSSAGQAILSGQDQDAASPGLSDSPFGPASFGSSSTRIGWQSGRSSGSLEVEVGPNVRVNAEQVLPAAGLLGRSETTVAADEDGENIVVGFNDAQGFCGPPFGGNCTPQTPTGLSGFGFSTDGGETFTDGNAPPLFNNVFTRGDPWLDRGGRDKKTFFYANLAVDATSGAGLGVSVHRGHFKDDSFAWEDVHVFNAPNAPDDFYDKEAIAVDKQRRGLGVVSVTNFIKTCNVPQNGFGQIEVWRTTNGGDTWQGPVIVGRDLTFVTNPANADCGQAGTLQQSSAPVVGPDGEVFVAWQRGPNLGVAATSAQIVVARSLDGGANFDSPVVVATINSMRQNAPVGYNRDRINDHPRIAFATKGRLQGRVFVAFSSAVAGVAPAPITPCPTPPSPPPPAPPLQCRGQRLVSSQVFVSHSDDLGLTWSPGTPVASAPPATGLKRWWPVVTVERNGNVAVVYYESQEVPTTSTNPFCVVSLGGNLRRRGSASSLVNTFISTSFDGGLSFGTPVRVSSATSNWCTALFNIRPNFGDYIGSARAKERVLATWADSRNSPVDTFFAPIEVDNSP